MDLKINLRIITKNHAADSKIGFPLKIGFRDDWTHVSIPTAWELIIYFLPSILNKLAHLSVALLRVSAVPDVFSLISVFGSDRALAEISSLESSAENIIDRR